MENNQEDKNQKEFKGEKISHSNKKEGEMATIKGISKSLMWLALILIIVAGVTFFYKNILLTVIFLIAGGIIYVFVKEIAKMIKGVIG